MEYWFFNDREITVNRYYNTIKERYYYECTDSRDHVTVGPFEIDRL